MDHVQIRSANSLQKVVCTYLVHTTDGKKLHAPLDKVRTILLRPNNISQLREVHGLIHHYQKCTAKLSSKLHPLDALLGTNVPILQMDKYMRESIQSFEDRTYKYQSCHTIVTKFR